MEKKKLILTYKLKFFREEMKITGLCVNSLVTEIMSVCQFHCSRQVLINLQEKNMNMTKRKSLYSLVKHFSETINIIFVS